MFTSYFLNFADSSFMMMSTFYFLNFAKHTITFLFFVALAGQADFLNFACDFFVPLILANVLP